MDTLATAPLRDLLNSLTSLAALLSTSNSTASYASLPTLISSLIKADDDLTTQTLPALREHQANYSRILALRARAGLLADEISALIRSAAFSSKERVREQAKKKTLSLDFEDLSDDDDDDD
ncbi:hypothetical protein DV736_g1810, partial [Chaetothyriales sp. CBS 134916]